MSHATLAEIKEDALKTNDLMINWKRWDHQGTDDVQRLKDAIVASIPGLEHVYDVLIRGESSLPFGEQEEAREAIIDELYSAYQLVDVMDRYLLIKEITKYSM